MTQSVCPVVIRLSISLLTKCPGALSIHLSLSLSLSLSVHAVIQLIVYSHFWFEIIPSKASFSLLKKITPYIVDAPCITKT